MWQRLTMTRSNFSEHLEVFSRIKICGEFGLSSSVFLTAQIKLQAIPQHTQKWDVYSNNS